MSLPASSASAAAAGKKIRPIQRFAATVAKCGPESAAYGQCILADYRNVSKDMCAKEFLRLKECFVKHSKQR